MVGLFLVMSRFVKAIRLSITDPEFRALLAIIGALLGIGTIFYSNVEGWHWFDSLYFSVVTLATVGYGDLTPQTTLGKLFTMIYIFLGIGVLVAFGSKMVRALVDTRKNSEARHQARLMQNLQTRLGNELDGSEDECPADQ